MRRVTLRVHIETEATDEELNSLVEILTHNVDWSFRYRNQTLSYIDWTASDHETTRHPA